MYSVGKFMNEKNPRFQGFPTAEMMDNSDYDLAYEKYQERFADVPDSQGTNHEQRFELDTYFSTLSVVLKIRCLLKHPTHDWTPVPNSCVLRLMNFSKARQRISHIE